MVSDAPERWFAMMVDVGLREKILEPADLLRHATPEILAKHLPPELMSQVLQSSLTSGAMTADSVIDTVTPDLLAKYLPHQVLWACIAEAAGRAGMAHDKQPGIRRPASRTLKAVDSGPSVPSAAIVADPIVADPGTHTEE